MSFADLKRNRQTDISKLVSQAEKASGSKESRSDDRFWAPQVDKAGNGYAVLRFLPAPKGEEVPWVRYWDHGFKGPTGKWYIENSLTSIGQKDPVAELNSALWNSGRDEDKALVRERKRRLHYVSNVLVISDPANPANEGKVFLFKFGKKIFDKVRDVMQPQFQDEKPVNPFDFWEGANFKLKIRKVEGYRNYDKSEFDSVTPLLGGDDKKLEEIYNQLNPLKDFIDPKNYKSYAELETKLKQVIGDGGVGVGSAEHTNLPDDDETTAAAPARRTAEAPQARTAPASKPAAEAGEDDEGETESLSYFAKLAKGE